jgi:hypothetical protein
LSPPENPEIVSGIVRCTARLLEKKERKREKNKKEGKREKNMKRGFVLENLAACSLGWGEEKKR